MLDPSWQAGSSDTSGGPQSMTPEVKLLPLLGRNGLAAYVVAVYQACEIAAGSNGQRVLGPRLVQTTARSLAERLVRLAAMSF